MADRRLRFDAEASPQVLKPPALPVPMSSELVVRFWQRRPAPKLASRVLPRRIRLDWLAPTIWTKISRHGLLPASMPATDARACSLMLAPSAP
jgi:hypothetical protein